MGGGLGMTEGIVLVAAGGLAREALAALRAGTPPRSVVLLDDDPALHGTTIGGAKVVGTVKDVKRYDDHSVVVCAGKGSVRRLLVERLADVGVTSDRFATVIHPAASVPDSCPIGYGSIVLAGVVLTADVTIGSHVVIMPNAVLTHDNVLDDYVTLAAAVALGGGVQVGEGAYLGMHATVREGLRVGAEAMLGMGSALVTHLPAAETWSGVPAKRLRGCEWSRP